MPFLGEIAGLVTAVCWSVTSIVFSKASQRIGSLQVNLLRLPLAIILLVFTISLLEQWSVSSHSAIIWLSLSGVIGLALGDSFLFEAFVQIGSRLSMLLLSLAPPMTAILAFFILGETISPLGIAGIVVTIAGVSWVVTEKREEGDDRKRINLRGIIYGLLAALGQAVGLILAKQGLSENLPPILATLIRMSAAALILWPLSLTSRRVKNPFRMLKSDLTALRLLLTGVFFGPFVGVTLSLVSVKYTDTGIAATLMSTVPVIMLPLVVWLEKERLTWRAVWGAVVTVAGVALLFLR
ncbi:MAG: DMT family transporter [Calditrichia bacterium]